MIVSTKLVNKRLNVYKTHVYHKKGETTFTDYGDISYLDSGFEEWNNLSDEERNEIDKEKIKQIKLI